jgi:hypothetical protein
MNIYSDLPRRTHKKYQHSISDITVYVKYVSKNGYYSLHFKKTRFVDLWYAVLLKIFCYVVYFLGSKLVFLSSTPAHGGKRSKQHSFRQPKSLKSQ